MEDDDDLLDEFLGGESLLTAEMQQAIALILPSEDPLDLPDFDLIEYINELFPNEQSLSNIDEIISRDKSRIRYIKNITCSSLKHLSFFDGFLKQS